MFYREIPAASRARRDNGDMQDLLKRLHAAETHSYQSSIIVLLESVMLGKLKDAEIVAGIRKATGHYTMARAYEHALKAHQRSESAKAKDGAS